jgi:hypothetical protein
MLNSYNCLKTMVGFYLRHRDQTLIGSIWQNVPVE